MFCIFFLIGDVLMLLDVLLGNLKWTRERERKPEGSSSQSVKLHMHFQNPDMWSLNLCEALRVILTVLSTLLPVQLCGMYRTWNHRLKTSTSGNGLCFFSFHQDLGQSCNLFNISVENDFASTDQPAMFLSVRVPLQNLDRHRACPCTFSSVCPLSCLSSARTCPSVPKKLQISEPCV